MVLFVCARPLLRACRLLCAEQGQYCDDRALPPRHLEPQALPRVEPVHADSPGIAPSHPAGHEPVSTVTAAALSSSLATSAVGTTEDAQVKPSPPYHGKFVPSGEKISYGKLRLAEQLAARTDTFSPGTRVLKANGQTGAAATATVGGAVQRPSNSWQLALRCDNGGTEWREEAPSHWTAHPMEANRNGAALWTQLKADFEAKVGTLLQLFCLVLLQTR